MCSPCGCFTDNWSLTLGLLEHVVAHVQWSVRYYNALIVNKSEPHDQRGEKGEGELGQDMVD